jgi:hypothetical protein
LRPALETLESRRLMSASGTLTVVNTLDSGAGSLRAQITAAHNGDSIVFAASLAGQTITLTSGELLIKQNIAIAGPSDRNVTISGGGHSRVLDVSKTVRNALLSGLTISNGSAPGNVGGGGILNNGTLTLSNSTLSGNATANGDGGGIQNDGTLTISNSILSANTAGYGGALFNYHGLMTVNGCTLTGNSASDGGGIWNDATLSVSGSALSNNSAFAGGGIYTGVSSFNGTTTITGSTLSGNSASGVGGGIYNYYGALVISGDTLSSNVAALQGGGGIYSTGGTLTVSGSTFNLNSPDNIVGLYIDNGGNTFV